MMRAPRHLVAGILVLALVVLLIGSLTNLSVLATRPADEPTPTPEFLVFVPVIAKQIPPTPTPTPTPIPVNVSGVYYTVGTNMVTDCPGGVALPEPSNVTVVHDGTHLTMTFPSGPSEGTINPITGEFQVSQVFPPSENLRYGGNRNTSGTFRLTQEPLVFNGITTFVINSETGIYCTFSFNHDGTRTQANR